MYILYMYTCICIHVYVYMYMYTCICIHVYVYMYMYTCICIHVYVYMYMYTCICIHVCVYMYVYTCICIHVYVHTHTHTHTRIGLDACPRAGVRAKQQTIPGGATRKAPLTTTPATAAAESKHTFLAEFRKSQHLSIFTMQSLCREDF